MTVSVKSPRYIWVNGEGDVYIHITFFCKNIVTSVYLDFDLAFQVLVAYYKFNISKTPSFHNFITFHSLIIVVKKEKACCRTRLAATFYCKLDSAVILPRI
jgi:hypothetical protein